MAGLPIDDRNMRFIRQSITPQERAQFSIFESLASLVYEISRIYGASSSSPGCAADRLVRYLIANNIISYRIIYTDIQREPLECFRIMVNIASYRIVLGASTGVRRASAIAGPLRLFGDQICNTTPISVVKQPIQKTLRNGFDIFVTTCQQTHIFSTGRQHSRIYRHIHRKTLQRGLASSAG